MEMMDGGEEVLTGEGFDTYDVRTCNLKDLSFRTLDLLVYLHIIINLSKKVEYWTITLLTIK